MGRLRDSIQGTAATVWIGVILSGSAVFGAVVEGSDHPHPTVAATQPATSDAAQPPRMDPALEALGVGESGSPWISSRRADLDRVPPRLLAAYLDRSDRWRDEVIPILASHDVPEEFVYLALIESGMDPAAESPAAAAGLWQFTPETARQYGLVVGDSVDERLDWRRSTGAAGRYLRDLYRQFGTWELAAAAYNAGPGRVSRALAETGSESYWDLLEIGRLPAETRAYVPKFLAIVQLAASRERTDEREAVTPAADD